MIGDVRYAARVLRASPIFTAVAVGSLSLAVAANTVIFSLLNAAWWRPLPVPDTHELIRVGATDRGQGFQVVSHPEFLDLRASGGVFGGLIASRVNSATVSVGDEPRETFLEAVSPGFFDVLDVRASRGRTFLPDELAGAGDGGAVVIGDALWRRRFGADPAVLGADIKINGRPFTVVGVVPPAFRGTFFGLEVDLWVPLTHLERVFPGDGSIENRADRFLNVIGRLRPDATLRAAQAQLDGVASRLVAAFPDDHRDRGYAVASAAGVHPSFSGVARAAVAFLMGIVGMVLAIAVANLANLHLARTLARRRELAVRRALGAARSRLARLLVAESLVIGMGGAIGGLALTTWATGILSAYRPNVGVPIAVELTPDLRVIAFTVVVGLVTGLAFGLLPALHSARLEPMSILRDVASGPRRAWLRDGLVIVQVAGASVLLVGAGLLGRGMLQAGRIDPGFDRSSVYVLSANPSVLGYDAETTRAVWEELEARIGALPMVRATARGLFVPLGSRSDRMVGVPVDAGEPDGTSPAYHYSIIDDDYLALLGIPVVRGRGFASEDRTGAPEVAIVNQTLARRWWGETDPIGRRFRLWDRTGQDRTVTVVGLARDAKYRSLAEPPTPFIYLPDGQWYRPDPVLHARVEGGRAAAVAILNAARGVDAELAVQVSPMATEMRMSTFAARVVAVVFGVSGGVGLFLAAIGIFGVVAYTAAQRTREIGIRMALGATRHAVRRAVAGRGVVLSAVGIGLGFGVALVASRILGNLLYGIRPTDPVTYATIALVLGGTGCLAAYLPTRAASTVDPITLLRED